MHLPMTNEELAEFIADPGIRYTNASLEKRLDIWINYLYWCIESAGSFNAPDFQLVVYSQGRVVEKFYISVLDYSSSQRELVQKVLDANYPEAVEWPYQFGE